MITGLAVAWMAQRQLAGGLRLVSFPVLIFCVGLSLLPIHAIGLLGGLGICAFGANELLHSRWLAGALYTAIGVYALYEHAAGLMRRSSR